MPTTTNNEALTIKFSKPFEFEKETYESVDLSGLEDITAAHLSAVEEQVTAIVPELSLEYALILAAQVTEHPVEFFKSLPGKEGLKIKRVVQSFLNN